MKMIKIALLALLTSISFLTQAEDGQKALITLTSEQQQTRGMAMVLANSMQTQGVQVDVLLCDSAGDMALQNYQSIPLKPKNVTPEQLMQKLIKSGASVKVCALYLPNAGKNKDALIEGVSVAKPPEMAKMLMAPNTKVFNF